MARCGWRPADRDGGGCAPGRWKPTAPSRPCPTRMAGRSAPARTAISGRAPGQDWPAGWKTGSSRCRETGCRLGRGRLGRVRSTKPCWAITGGSGTRHRRHSATNYAPRTAPFDSSPPIPPAASMPAAGAGFGNGMWRGTGPGNMARLPDPPGGSGWKVRPGRSPWAAWTGVSITDLRPGRQRFELRSAASDGAWRGTCVELARGGAVGTGSRGVAPGAGGLAGRGPGRPRAPCPGPPVRFPVDLEGWGLRMRLAGRPGPHRHAIDPREDAGLEGRP